MMIVDKASDADKITDRIEEHFACNILPVPKNVEQLVDQVKSEAPDIVAITSDWNDFNWATAVYELKRINKTPAVVVFADKPDNEKLFSAFREGADAYIVKDTPRDQFVSALKAVENGHIFYRQEDANEIRNHMLYLELGSAQNVGKVKNGIAKLTVREKEVFPLLADGNTVKEVAKILGISPKTVETHKYHIMEKLDINRMADLTRLAIIKDLIPI